MSVVDFLEKVGQDTQLCHGSPDALNKAAAQARLDPEILAAILAKDQARLEALLGCGLLCGMLNPAEEEDEPEDEPSREDEEIGALLIRRASARMN
jgi:hypothetical protein